MDSIEVTDTEAHKAAKTPNRVTLEHINGNIAGTEYFHPDCLPSMTIAVVQHVNGFVVLGKSAPADPKNYDETLGKKFAKEDAIRQLWHLEGFVMREMLSAGLAK